MLWVVVRCRQPAAGRAALVPAAHDCCARRLPGSPPRRKLAELEAQLIEEETAARITEAIEARVAEALASEAVQQSLQQRLEEERRNLEQQVGQPLAALLQCLQPAQPL